MARVSKTAERTAFDVEVGRRIALTRNALQISGRELARAAGISGGSLYFYETGRTSCPVSILSQIAASLGVTVSVLVPKSTKCRFPEKSSQR